MQDVILNESILNEPILQPEPNRYCLFPLKHKDIHELYKQAEAMFWQAGEVDLSADRFDELSDDEKKYLKFLLAFFAGSDTIVNKNIDNNFLSSVENMEVKRYYDFQITMENIHSEMYALLIEEYIKDEQEKIQMFDAIQQVPAVSKKSSWAVNWLDKGNFIEKLIAFACVEGLSFSSTFAGIFYFRQSGKLPGLCTANEFIMRDECSHMNFAIYLYKYHIQNKLEPSRIKEIVLSCLDTEIEFIENIFPSTLVGLTKENMIDYCKFVADSLLENFGVEKEFYVEQPLVYMDKLALDFKTNFFDRRVTFYSKTDIGDNGFEISDDF